MVDARRQEQRQHHRGHEQQRDQRHAADQLDEADAQRLDHRQLRAPAERQQDAEREGERQCRTVARISVTGRPPHSAGLDVAERRRWRGSRPAARPTRRSTSRPRRCRQRPPAVELAPAKRWRRAGSCLPAGDQRDEQDQARSGCGAAEHQQEGDEAADRPDHAAGASSTSAGRSSGPASPAWR